MLRVRTRLYPKIERGVLALGWLRAAEAKHGRGGKRLIFVCSGNICRSPYAEAIARMRGLNAISCGTHTRTGLPADGLAVTEAARRAVDLTSHTTTRWEDIELEEGDLIIAMQLRHAWAVLPRARAHHNPVVMLSSLLAEFAPVWDPYGKPGDAYERAFDLIDAGVQRMTQWHDLAARELNGCA
jgi:protein-tyrosine phosphatase